MSQNNIYKRQADIVKPTELMFPITIIGAGGIGSWTALSVAKMGAFSITTIDFDRVEEHNIPSQIYGPEDIGLSKVDALQKIISIFTDRVTIPFSDTVQQYVAKSLPFGKVVVCAVDSLEERKKIWEIIKPLLHPGSIDLYIDARMGGEQLRILCVSPYNAESIIKYSRKMDSPTKPDDTPCTARSIIYNTTMIGGMIASLIKKYAKGQEIEFDYMFSCAVLERV